MNHLNMFDNFYVDSTEYDFFNKLPDSEKLLYLYNVICRDFDSFESEYDVEMIEHDDSSFLTDNIFTEEYLETTEYVINEAIAMANLPLNIVYVNEYIIINSKDEKEMAHLILDLIADGCVFEKLPKNKLIIHHLKKFDYFEILKVKTVSSQIFY